MSPREKLVSTRSSMSSPDLVVYHLEGELRDDKDSFGLLESVRKDLRKDTKFIIINLRKISYLSSGGIGILAAVFTSCKKSSAHVVLVEVPEFSISLLKLVCLWDIIEHIDTEKKAIEYALTIQKKGS